MSSAAGERSVSRRGVCSGRRSPPVRADATHAVRRHDGLSPSKTSTDRSSSCCDGLELWGARACRTGDRCDRRDHPHADDAHGRQSQTQPHTVSRERGLPQPLARVGPLLERCRMLMEKWTLSVQ